MLFRGLSSIRSFCLRASCYGYHKLTPSAPRRVSPANHHPDIYLFYSLNISYLFYLFKYYFSFFSLIYYKIRFLSIHTLFLCFLRNEFAFNSIRSLALRAVALECDKAIFFRGLPLGYLKPYFIKLFLRQSVWL
jgi:hypothetical protein